MTVAEIETKKKLFLDAFHRENTSKLISFSDWEVPAYFSSIIDEHLCVRQKVGIFDISHMGEFLIEGRDSKAFLQFLTTNDLNRYPFGKAFYSLMCNETGGVVDDVFIYPVNEEKYFMVVNAANIEKDNNWIVANSDKFQVTIKNRSDARGLIALQGPKSDAVLSKALSFDSKEIKFHEFCEMTFEGSSILVSATGYTGERGFEIMYDKDQATSLWQALLNAGQEEGIQPIGFGARDTLRLEANCALYGHELAEDIPALESNLGWVVKLEKEEDFIGKTSLQELKEKGPSRKIYGLVMVDRSVPRQGYSVFLEGENIGTITSGSFLPLLEKNGALALLNRTDLNVGSQVEIDIRSKKYRAEIIQLPFYKRAKGD